MNDSIRGLTVIGLTALSVAVPLRGAAQTNACSPAINNPSCTITIDRDAPSSPLQMRMKDGATVTLTVRKRPLDTVQLELTTTDVAVPDPAAAILTAFLPSLFKLQFDVKTVRPSDVSRMVDFTWANVDPLPSSPINDLLKRLAQISTRQTTAETDLKATKTKVDAAAVKLREFQERSITAWSKFTFATEQAALVTTLTEAASALHPGGAVASARVALDDVAEAVALLPTPTPGQQAAFDTLTQKLNEVAFNQGRLETGVKAIESAQASLDQAAGTIKRLDGARAFVSSREFTESGDEVGRSVSVKVASQDALSKTTTALGTVVMVWNETRWEVSAGALFSKLQMRSFQNAPIVINGEPQLDSGGKVKTIVTESVARPTVVPFALMHYRVGETPVAGRRLAALATFGIGVNGSSGSADFALGGTVAYRALFVSVVGHYGRDLKLSNGVEPGDELGSSPPALATERFWTWSRAVAVGLRVPF
jgi:hypothetical protein